MPDNRKGILAGWRPTRKPPPEMVLDRPPVSRAYRKSPQLRGRIHDFDVYKIKRRRANYKSFLKKLFEFNPIRHASESWRFYK